MDSPFMDADAFRGVLADRIRKARQESGLSLSELSRRSGIGKATLSALEAGGGNPTIDTVFSLSRALELPISDLLVHESDGVRVVRGDEIEVLSGPAVDLRLLRTIERHGAVVEVFDQQVRPGVRQDSLGHVGTEHTIVQAGRLRVTVGEQTVELGPGDAITFDAHVSHSYEALETGPDGAVRSVLLLDYPPGTSRRQRPHAR